MKCSQDFFKNTIKNTKKRIRGAQVSDLFLSYVVQKEAEHMNGQIEMVWGSYF